jgi:hypothetical protein
VRKCQFCGNSGGCRQVLIRGQENRIWSKMSSTKEIKETNKDIGKSKVGLTEIHEWNMELRNNNFCMDEHNADVRMKKVEEIEKSEAKGREGRDRENAERERTNQERERANEKRERTNDIRELANDEKECTNKDKEIANDKREKTKDENFLGRRKSNKI